MNLNDSFEAGIALMVFACSMRYVAAYLLAVLGGNSSPSDKDLKKILSSVGIDADDACMKKVISELKGKNVEDVMASGTSRTTLFCWNVPNLQWCTKHNLIDLLIILNWNFLLRIKQTTFRGKKTIIFC